MLGASVRRYELVSLAELLSKGPHSAFLLLDGVPIAGSSLEFDVMHGNAVAAKSWLEIRPGPTPAINWPCECLLHLVDKFGNAVERGDVRVEAKVCLQMHSIAPTALDRPRLPSANTLDDYPP